MDSVNTVPEVECFRRATLNGLEKKQRCAAILGQFNQVLSSQRDANDAINLTCSLTSPPARCMKEWLILPLMEGRQACPVCFFCDINFFFLISELKIVFSVLNTLLCPAHHCQLPTL